MNQYTGVITLTEYIPPDLDGKGLEGVQNLYALSSNGITPPGEGEAVAFVEEGKLVVNKKDGQIFNVVEDDKVKVLDDSLFYFETDTKLTILENVWMETPPKTTKGQYLWTKTEYNYTDGNNDKTYTVGYIGADGKPGLDANPYIIETNCEEILLFETRRVTESDFKYEYSPSNLTIKVYDNKELELKEIIPTKYNFKLEHLQDGKFVSIPEEYIDFGNQSYQESNQDRTLYFDIESYAKTYPVNSSLVFRFSYLKNSQVMQRKIIPVRFGVSEEMAKFNINAADITASIEEGHLKFSKEGLTYTNENEKVFSVGGTGEVYVKGTIHATNGSFTGTVIATDGIFRGELQATSGKIGGLTIAENVLYSGSSLEDSILKIYGSGEVYAQSIVLGENAVIENQIQLGNAYIKNPAVNEDVFLQAGRVQILQSGILHLGDIYAFGGNEQQDSCIKAGNDSAFWQINGNGTANFREITVDKATIQNSIMEIGRVQAVGSTVFFKDSWKVASVSGKSCSIELILKDSNGNFLPPPLNKGDYILSNGSNYYQIEEVNNENITFDRECSFSKGDIITKIGSQDDYLITIQGDSTQNFQYSKNNCLTLSSISVLNDDIPTFEKKIVLGDLTGMPGATGTGLYAENVFLNGTLTTKIQSNENSTYAGINTLTGANSIIFGDEDKTKIVFWAGSSGVSAEDIQKAAFQVTESGSIYANKGRFEGSLITDSIIKGASIHTAKIYGEDTKGNQAALQIFDTQRGIQFIDNEASNKVQLGISSAGFYTETDGLFVEMSEGIGYLGQRATYSNNEDSILFVRPNYIGFDNNISSTEPSWKIKHESGFGFVNGENSIFEIKNDLIKSTKKVNFEQNLTFGINNTQGALEYQKTAEGFYNLYVR